MRTYRDGTEAKIGDHIHDGFPPSAVCVILDFLDEDDTEEAWDTLVEFESPLTGQDIRMGIDLENYHKVP